MAASHEIEVFISDTGELKIHIKGIKGPGCLKTLDTLAKDTGKIKDKKLTSEYYEKSVGETAKNTRIGRNNP